MLHSHINTPVLQLSLLNKSRLGLYFNYKIKQDILSGPPTSDVPKLTAKTYDLFIHAFTNKASNIMGVNGTTLDYFDEEYKWEL